MGGMVHAGFVEGNPRRVSRTIPGVDWNGLPISTLGAIAFTVPRQWKGPVDVQCPSVKPVSSPLTSSVTGHASHGPFQNLFPSLVCTAGKAGRDSCRADGYALSRVDRLGHRAGGCRLHARH